MKYLVLAAILVLAAPAAAQTTQPPADERPTAYATEYDSLQRRAARVRSRTDAAITRFKTHLAGLGGTSRRTRSFGSPRVLVLPTTGETAVKKFMIKRQIVKHKTHNAEIEKVFYYGAGKRVLLYEYYEQQQLVHRSLYEYAVRDGREYGAPLRTAQWVRGDYLQLTVRPEQGRRQPLHYYFTAPRPLN